MLTVLHTRKTTKQSAYINPNIESISKRLRKTKTVIGFSLSLLQQLQ